MNKYFLNFIFDDAIVADKLSVFTDLDLVSKLAMVTSMLETACVIDKFQMLVTNFHLEKVTYIIILKANSSNYNYGLKICWNPPSLLNMKNRLIKIDSPRVLTSHSSVDNNWRYHLSTNLMKSIFGNIIIFIVKYKLTLI